MAISVRTETEQAMMNTRLAWGKLHALTSTRKISGPELEAILLLAEITKQLHTAVRRLIDANTPGGDGATINL